MRDYKEAMDAPAKEGKGWKYADNDSMCAALAESMGRMFCLNPASVYWWIQECYGGDYKEVMKQMPAFQSDPLGLVESVLENERTDS